MKISELTEGFGIDPAMVAAEANVERHIGDIAAGDGIDNLRDEVWSLAHDGAMDAGAAHEAAARIADKIAAGY